MLREQAVPQKSLIFKWILELKRQSTMLMYRCGSEASGSLPAVALVSQTLTSSGLCVSVCGGDARWRHGYTSYDERKKEQ